MGSYDVPVRTRRSGEKPADFDANTVVLPSVSQLEAGMSLFRNTDSNAQVRPDPKVFPALGDICFVSVGMVINAHEDEYQGQFGAEDLLSDVRDALHPKRFVLGKDIAKWHIRRTRYLEWGTNRAPSHFRRPTFPELQEAREKLLAVRTPGSVPKVVYDDGSVHFDASSVGFVVWHHLEGVRNRSIRKSANYRDEVPSSQGQTSRFREEMERLSRKFEPKYLLAVMNSSYAREWISRDRRSKIHVYPDDWKKLPIAQVSLEKQREITKLVDQLLILVGDGRYSLTEQDTSEVAGLERELDHLVSSLYPSILHGSGDMFGTLIGTYR